MKEIVILVAVLAGLFGLTPSAFAASSSASQPVAAAKESGKTLKNEQSNVNLNTADQKELMKIKGIGKKRAQAIVDYRKANGSFANVKDLSKVKGMSDKRVEKLVASNPNIKI